MTEGHLSNTEISTTLTGMTIPPVPFRWKAPNLF